jgi:hypothetical protein
MSRYRFLQILKIAAFVISILFIVWHVSEKPELHEPSFLLEPLRDPAKRLLLISVLLLMLVNWSIEAVKWKQLLDPVERIGFLTSFRAVLSGLTVSFFTPNRVGEFAGRILHLEPGHRIRGALATFVGATAQAMITLQAGLVALVIFREDFISPGWIPLVVAITLLSVVLLPVLWLRIPHLAHWKLISSLLQRYPRYLEVFEHYRIRHLTGVYLLSALRYLVFCFQQYLLLRIFGFQESFLLSAGLSAISFLFITVIPGFAIGELGIRGSVNLLVFSPFLDNAGSILSVTFLLWLINLALPALFGAAGLLYIKIRRTG